MRCPRCQAETPSDAEFCPRCGAKLSVVCAQCGTANAPDHDFCKKCGQALTGVLRSGTLASPQAYTPKHLAEKILTSRSALEGERKQVTVLFCDIVESSRLAEQLDAEAMHEVMDRALRLMAEAVHRYEGTVNQFLGDGLMALFGAPVALEDHAFRAVQAALAIRETINGYSEQLKRERGVEMRLRLGLNTGLVVVGRIGDDLRMDYTAVGNTTHLAARMQALAEPGTILLTEATHRLVAGYIRSEALGPVQVKGRSEPVIAYKVTGRRRGRTRLEVTAERGLTQLVGRERELGLLHDCLARARAGRGQVVGIVGEPGVGKSRLLYEFRKSLEGERITWLEGHCVSYGQATPYGPILEILRTNFQIEDGDNPLQLHEKLRQGVYRLDPGLEGILPFLQALFGVPGADEALKHLDPKERREKTFEAIRTLTVAGSQRRPHVVIVEDLHWIDKTSEDYLAFLIAGLAGVPLLLLTTHRPGYTVRWADKPYYTQIALDLLAEGETEALVAALLGGRALPADLLRIVHEKAEGNPLFIEEITTSLLECGMLVRRNGKILWTGGAPVEVPASIQDLIRARIDRLEEPVKRTVQTAAVIGREFAVRLLARISEVAAEVQRYLDTLKRLEFIHEKRFFPELEFIFKHAVIQDVAYHTLLGQRRKELHGAIGRAIEELYADRLEEQAAILAYHYARSASQDKAIQYALLAGDRATRLYANAEARTYYKQALTTARGMAKSAEAQQAEIEATLKIAGVALTREHFEQDLVSLQQAQALAQVLDDLPRLSRVLYWLGRIHYTVGRMDTGIEYARRALELAEQLADETLQAPPVNLLGRAHFVRGEPQKACEFLARSVRQMDAIGNRIEEATAYGMLGRSRAHLGQFPGALDAGEHGLRIAEEIEHLPTLAACLMYRGQVKCWRGDFSGLEDLERGLEIAGKIGDVFRTYVIHATRGGWGYLLAGDPARAEQELRRALALTERLGTRFFLGGFKSYFAESRLYAGAIDEALQLSREALQIAEESGQAWDRSVALRTLAHALLAQEPPDDQGALEAIRSAVVIQEPLGMQWELAQSLVVHGRVLRTKGATAEARATLRRALHLFEEMGVTWGVARATQALSEL